jgi:3D (Asp-Asp-Asp) domain-containing protein
MKKNKKPGRLKKHTGKQHIKKQVVYQIIEKVLIIIAFAFLFEFSIPNFLEPNVVQAGHSTRLGPVAIAMEEDPEVVKIREEILSRQTQGQPKFVRWVIVTAYSSTPDQTDDSPFIAANNQLVHDGMVACNFLPFRTKIKIPDYFGDKVFEVGDRMNKKYNSRVDVWMPNRQEAIQFGARYLKIEVY